MKQSSQTRCRRDELESLFQRFPDVPREVVVKEDVLRNGLDFTESALQGEFRTKLYGGGLFTYDLVRPEEALHLIRRVPEDIEIHGGLYDLRGRVRCGVHLNPHSPYVVDKRDSELWLCERDGGGLSPIAQLHPYRPVPEFWSKSFDDGTPYKEILRDDAIVQTTVFIDCQYWGPNEECQYCDINRNLKEAKKRGDIHLRKSYKKVEQVAAVIEWLFLHERPKRPPYDRPRCIQVTGGAIAKKLAGLTEDEFYLQYVRAIKERVGGRWPLILQSAPKSKEEAKIYKEAGVDCHHPNMEVWDPRLFAIICPGKNRVVGREKWLRLMLEEVDVFGEGNVCPGFVQGCETAGPHGLSVDEAVKSYEEGYEFLMSHGVVPRPISWYVEPMSGLGRYPPPPTEYFIRIDRAWHQTWVKYRLPPPCGWLVGPGKSEFRNGGHLDME